MSNQVAKSSKDFFAMPNVEAKQGYQDKTSCNNCGGNNELLKAIVDDDIIYEVETKCKDCGFDDYWSHGFFHSRQDGFDNAKRIC